VKRLLNARETILALILIVGVAAIGLYQPVFVEWENISDLLTETSVLFMMALAQMTVILTRGIDLSVAANLALSGFIAALVSQYYPEGPLVLMILAGMATGLLLGLINGTLIAFLGIPSEQFPIDWKTVIFNMITIKGIYGRQMYETWYQMSVLLETGVDISPVVTHRYSYEDFELGFAAIKEGNCGKVILDFEEI